jgi:hypothetical protein
MKQPNQPKGDFILKIIGFIFIMCAFAGIAHGGINTGAIFGILIGLALMIPEYIFELKRCTNKK